MGLSQQLFSLAKEGRIIAHAWESSSTHPARDRYQGGGKT
jgi:hypothetical protein